jgi:hypothetical protein
MTTSPRSTLVPLNAAVGEPPLLEPDSATIDAPDDAVIPGLDVAVEGTLVQLGRRLTFRRLAPALPWACLTLREQPLTNNTQPNSCIVR